VPKNQPRYNVDMPKINIAINQEITIEISNLVENINKVTTKIKMEISNLINIST
jgi:hypothetical protein